MSELLILKVFLRALLVMLISVIFVIVFVHYVIATLVVLAISWFALMVQLDPPAEWDN